MGKDTTDNATVPKDVVSVSIPACKGCGGAKLQWPSDKQAPELETISDGRTEVADNQAVKQKDANNVNFDQFHWREFMSAVPGTHQADSLIRNHFTNWNYFQG